MQPASPPKIGRGSRCQQGETGGNSRRTGRRGETWRAHDRCRTRVTECGAIPALAVNFTRKPQTPIAPQPTGFRLHRIWAHAKMVPGLAAPRQAATPAEAPARGARLPPRSQGSGRLCHHFARDHPCGICNWLLRGSGRTDFCTTSSHSVARGDSGLSPV